MKVYLSFLLKNRRKFNSSEKNSFLLLLFFFFNTGNRTVHFKLSVLQKKSFQLPFLGTMTHHLLCFLVLFYQKPFQFFGQHKPSEAENQKGGG